MELESTSRSLANRGRSSSERIQALFGAVSVLALFAAAVIIGSGLFPTPTVSLTRDDPALSKPELPSTVPNWLLGSYAMVAVSFVLGCITFYRDTLDGRPRRGFWACIRSGNVAPQVLFCIQTSVLTLFITNTVKIFVGRPRPYFLSVCEPLSNVPSDVTVISSSACTGDIGQAQLSFPSGHASLSIAPSIYAILSIRWQFRDVPLSSLGLVFQSTLEALLLLFPMWSGGSRVSDNKHFVSDVVAGWVLGTLVAVSVARLACSSQERKHRGTDLPGSDRV